jgi:NAD+ synthase (glutamine-hydrolysing)
MLIAVVCSGGADSASVATIVYIMCTIAVKEAKEGNDQVIADLKTLSGSEEICSAAELCNIVLHTAYMSTENSSAATRNRAKALSEGINSYHVSFEIDTIVKAVLDVFSVLTNLRPKYEIGGGTSAEDLALQNIQARLRMVMAYLCAQLFPWLRGKSSFLLVLGSANVDESLRGYMTKYDCSSADLNPIGGICKGDLKRMLIWASGEFKLDIIADIAQAKPTAELRPLENNNGGYSQLDEDEMGMSYDELGVFGTLRKLSRCGPVTMFIQLLEKWGHISPLTVADKVKRFFKFYGINRHKMTTLTPSYHAENYSPDDNRFDLRQFLYNNQWPRHFRVIDALATEAQENRNHKDAADTEIDV